MTANRGLSSPPRPRAVIRIEPTSSPFDLAAYRGWRFRDGLACPRCGGRRVHRWGRFGDRRRYRCLTCDRTFSDLTGTPLAHLKHLDRWPQFCDALLATWTLRRISAELRFHVSTSFRWRHRVLDVVRAADSILLDGMVTVAETCFPHSEKGCRRLDRPARRRRSGAAWRTDPRVWILLASDESGRRWAGVAGSQRPTGRTVAAALEPRLGGAVALRDGVGRFGAVALLARRRGWPYAQLRRLSCADNPALAHGRRIRHWLARFRGVATRYLPNYLVWHGLLDVMKANAPCQPFFRNQLAIGSFP